MKEVAIDASLSLQWYLEDEVDRGYSLAVLERLFELKAIVPVVPVLWFYELGNGLTMACCRKRITYDQAGAYLEKVRHLGIAVDAVDPTTILTLPEFARKYELTNYDAAYLELAIRRNVPLATTDAALRRAAEKAGVPLLKPSE